MSGELGGHVPCGAVERGGGGTEKKGGAEREPTGERLANGCVAEEESIVHKGHRAHKGWSFIPNYVLNNSCVFGLVKGAAGSEMKETQPLPSEAHRVHGGHETKTRSRPCTLHTALHPQTLRETQRGLTEVKRASRTRRAGLSFQLQHQPESLDLSGCHSPHRYKKGLGLGLL